MPAIELRHVRNFILKDVDLAIRDGEFLVVLGPNGSGKSTLLNTIAGLVPYRGNLLFDGARVDDLPPEKRGVGYLFQHLALFPHLDVSANIAYAMKLDRSRPRREIAARTGHYLESLNIAHLARRYPRQLSGGEKQRVALARALAADPAILLLDEPMSSLDLKTAKYLRLEFRNLQRRLGATTLFVTHNLSEAAEIADRVAVFIDGRLRQIGPPDEVMFQPADEPVRRFIGQPNILNCDSFKIVENGLALVTCGGLPVIVPHEGKAVKKIAIAPEHVHVSARAPLGPSVNRFQATVTAIDRLDSLTRVQLDLAGHPIGAEMPTPLIDLIDLQVGRPAHVILKLRWIRTLNGD